jgi:predicted transcriptional regulator
VRITANVSVDVAQKLETIAGAQRVSISWLISRAIDQFLEQSGDDSAPQLPLRRVPPRTK